MQHDSERHFRRYEQYLRSILERWPTPTLIDPQGRSIHSFETHLRLAGSALLLHRWTTPIDLNFLKEIWPPKFSRIQTPGKLWIGPREAPLHSSPKLSLELTDRPLTEDAARDLLRFCSHRLHHPILVTTKLPLVVLAADFDVAVEQLSPNTYRIY